MRYFTTGGPGKEHRSNKRPPTVRTWERSKETPRVLPLPRLLLNALHFDWAMHVPPEYPESEWLARKNPETNLITIKPKIESHVVGQFSQVPLPFCSPLRRPFSKVSCQHVCLLWQFIYECYTRAPFRAAPSCNIWVKCLPLRPKLLLVLLRYSWYTTVQQWFTIFKLYSIYKTNVEALQ